VPGSDGNELITVGRNGIFYSYDQGNSWKKINDATNLNVLQFVDNHTVVAAGQKNIVRFKLK